jgi:hypothetical protein
MGTVSAILVEQVRRRLYRETTDTRAVHSFRVNLWGKPPGDSAEPLIPWQLSVRANSPEEAKAKAIEIASVRRGFTQIEVRGVEQVPNQEGPGEVGVPHTAPLNLDPNARMGEVPHSKVSQNLP